MTKTAVIEIPMGSKYKYEHSEVTQVLWVDRVINQRVPYNYGYLPFTTAADGDPVDIFICTNEPLPPLVKCKVKIIGGFKCTDQGVRDDKLVGILEGEDIYPNLIAIKQYLETYKEGFVVLGEFIPETILKEVLERDSNDLSNG